MALLQAAGQVAALTSKHTGTAQAPTPLVTACRAGAAVQVSPPKRAQHGSLWRYRKWLGKWLPEYDDMTIETEIALQVGGCWCWGSVCVRAQPGRHE